MAVTKVLTIRVIKDEKYKFDEALRFFQSMGGLDDVNDVEAYCQNLALFVMFSSLYCLCLISIPCSGNSYAIAVVKIR